MIIRELHRFQILHGNRAFRLLNTDAVWRRRSVSARLRGHGARSVSQLHYRVLIRRAVHSTASDIASASMHFTGTMGADSLCCWRVASSADPSGPATFGKARQLPLTGTCPLERARSGAENPGARRARSMYGRIPPNRLGGGPSDPQWVSVSGIASPQPAHPRSRHHSANRRTDCSCSASFCLR